MSEKETFGKKKKTTSLKNKLLSENTSDVILCLFSIDENFDEMITSNMYKKMKNILHTCRTSHPLKRIKLLNGTRINTFRPDTKLYKVIQYETDEEIISCYCLALIDRIKTLQQNEIEKRKFPLPVSG